MENCASCDAVCFFSFLILSRFFVLNKIQNLKSYLFWLYLKLTKNAPIFFKNIIYVKVYEKTSFGINFGPWELPQPEHAWMHALSLSCLFLLRHFLKSKIHLKEVFIKTYIIAVLAYTRWNENSWQGLWLSLWLWLWLWVWLCLLMRLS